MFTIKWKPVHVAVESVFTIPWKHCSPSCGIRSPAMFDAAPAAFGLEYPPWMMHFYMPNLSIKYRAIASPPTESGQGVPDQYRILLFICGNNCEITT